MIKIQLGVTAVRRNASEWRDVPTASTDGRSVVSDRAPIAELCRIPLSEGVASAESEVVVKRGSAGVFAPIPLGVWAGLTVSDVPSCRFRKFRGETE